MKHWTMDQIKTANRVRNLHWFDPSALRFFKSRVSDFTACGPGGVFFVSSERFDERSPRRYSVRSFDPETGNINTVGDFQAYGTGATARRHAERYARDGAPVESPASEAAR